MENFVAESFLFDLGNVAILGFFLFWIYGLSHFIYGILKRKISEENQYWFWIILLIPPMGSLVYLLKVKYR